MGIAFGFAADDAVNDFVSSRLSVDDILTIKE